MDDTGHYKTRECTECGKKQRLDIPDSLCEHNSLRTIARIEPTCTEVGYEEYFQCEYCGIYLVHEEDKLIEVNSANLDEYMNKLTIPTKGHKYGEWSTVREPTVDEEGLAERVCEYDNSHKEYKSIDKLDPSGDDPDPNGDEPDSKQDVEYKLVYKLNGGEYNGSKDDIVEYHTDGSKIKIHEAPNRDGYELLYWKGSEYQPGQEYDVTENHTFTAQWKKNDDSIEPDNSADSDNTSDGTDGDKISDKTDDGKVSDKSDSDKVSDKGTQTVESSGSDNKKRTFAIRCIEAGVQPVVLKTWLGHTNIHMTLDIYSDVFDKMDFGALE